jgi:quinol monooxygenase YgiN
MILEYIRYHMAQDRRADFERAYQAAEEALKVSPHCLAYELSHDVEEPDHYILRLEWDSLDGHLQGFRASPEFRSFFAAVSPYVGDIEEMHHYEPIQTTARTN